MTEQPTEPSLIRRNTMRTRHSRFRSMAKRGLFWIVFVVASGCLVGSGLLANEEPIVPLEYNLIVSNPEICAGESKVHLRFELRNISTHPVQIDPRGVYYSRSLRLVEDKLVQKLKPSYNSVSDPMPSETGDTNLRTLGPGESFRDSYEYVLPANVPQTPGIYELSFTYGAYKDSSSDRNAERFRGAVESNVVLLRVRECRPND